MSLFSSIQNVQNARNTGRKGGKATFERFGMISYSDDVTIGVS